MNRPLTRRIGWWLEAAALGALLGLFRALPVDAASALGGWLGRLILGVTRLARVADANLAARLPEVSARERRRIRGEVLAQMGRQLGEYPHLARLAGPDRTEIVGTEHLEALAGSAFLLVSGHMGNFELISPVLRRLGRPIAAVYRAPNNPYVDRIAIKLRAGVTEDSIPKGALGARAMLRRLKKGEAVGLLIDQKMNDGIVVPFFGVPAMTAPGVAELSERYGVPILPLRCERLGGARFRMTLYPPFQVECATGESRSEAIYRTMAMLNVQLEGWIRERPAQWLWTHRRWPPGGSTAEPASQISISASS